MKREVFRKESLDRLSSPEQLDLLMPVTSSRAWLALGGIGLILAMGLAWGIFGAVQTTVEGTGLLMRFKGFALVAPTEPGQVLELSVDSDSDVGAGDLLFTYLPAKSGDPPDVREVRSPVSGRVLDAKLRAGNYFGADEQLVSIEAPDAPLQAVVYVPASDGFKVASGMDVRILPANVSKQGGSFLRGRVTSVARFPSTHAQLMYSLQNEEWVSSLLRLGPTLEVNIDIPSDRPLEEFYSGTPCSASIVVDRQRPISFLLPTTNN